MFLWCSQCLSCLWRSGFSRCLLWTIYWGRSSPGSSTWCAICEIFHPESCTAEEEEFAFICEAKDMVFDLPFTPLELGEAAVRVFWNWVGEESTDRAQLLCFFWRSSPALGGSYLSLRTTWFRFFDKTWQKGSYNSFWMLQISGEYQNFQLFS